MSAFYELIGRILDKYTVPTLFGGLMFGIVYTTSTSDSPKNFIYAGIAGVVVILLVIGLQSWIRGRDWRWSLIDDPFDEERSYHTQKPIIDSQFQWHVDNGSRSIRGITCQKCYPVDVEVYERSYYWSRRRQLIQLECPKCHKKRKYKGTWSSVQKEMGWRLLQPLLDKIKDGENIKKQAPTRHLAL